MTDRLNRAIGRWSLAALMLNTVIGASIFGLPALIAAQLGAASPLGFVVAAVAMTAIAGCLAEVASQFSATGGPYLYAREAFGRFIAIQIGWITWLSRIASAAAAANLFVSYLGQFVPSADTSSALRALLLVAVISCVAALNYRGVVGGARLSNGFTVSKLLVVFVFVGGGLAALSLRPDLRVAAAPSPITVSNWLEGLLLMTVAFGGFEAALFPSGEARSPRKDVAVALTAALGVATAVYVGMQYVVIHTLANASASTRPVADAAQHLLGPRGASFIAAGTIISVLGSLTANMLHTPRIVFAMGEQGDLPPVFGSVHQRFRTPHVAIVLFALVLSIFAIAGTYQWNATLSGVSRLFIYGSIAAALPVLRRRQPNADAVRVPGGLVLSGLSLIFTAALATRMDLGGATVAAGTFALASVNWWWARRTSSTIEMTQETDAAASRIRH